MEEWRKSAYSEKTTDYDMPVQHSNPHSGKWQIAVRGYTLDQSAFRASLKK